MKPKHEFIVHYNEDLSRLSLYSPSLDRFMSCGTFTDIINDDVKGAFVFDVPTASKDETEFEVRFDEFTRSVTLYYAKHHSHHWAKDPILIQRPVAAYSADSGFRFLSLIGARYTDPLKFFFEPVATD